MTPGDWPSPVASKAAAEAVGLKPIAPPARTNPAEFEEDRAPVKITITCYGPKDGGKSTQAFGLPGVKFVLAHDGQSKAARDNSIHKGNPAIRVFNAVKHYIETDQPSAQRTVDHIHDLLDFAAANVHPDWVIIDAFDIQSEIAEGVMRARHGLLRSDSFANRNLWKERKDIIRGIWRHSIDVARLGVVYCTYYKEEALSRENGEVVASRKAPHWLDIIQHETMITVEVTRTYSEIAKKNTYKAVVEGCKLDDPNSVVGCVFKSGETFDVTGKTLPWTERLAKFVALADKGQVEVSDATPENEIAVKIAPGPAKPTVKITADDI